MHSSSKKTLLTSFFMKFTISYTYVFHTTVSYIWGGYYLGLINDTLGMILQDLVYHTKLESFGQFLDTLCWQYLWYIIFCKKNVAPRKWKCLKIMCIYEHFYIFIHILNHKNNISLIHFCYSMYSCSKNTLYDVILNSIYYFICINAYLCFVPWIRKFGGRVHSEANKI